MTIERTRHCIARIVWGAARRTQRTLSRAHRALHYRISNFDYILSTIHGKGQDLAKAVRRGGTVVAGCGCVDEDAFSCGVLRGNWLVVGEHEGHGCFCKCHEEP